MRAVIRASSEFGSFAIMGEEGGLEGGEGPYRWLLDPIDGTMSFTRGMGWGCLTSAWSGVAAFPVQAHRSGALRESTLETIVTGFLLVREDPLRTLMPRTWRTALWVG